MRTIKNVTLTKIENRGMFFEWEKPHKTMGKSLWLAGYNRPSNVAVGDMGKLEYRITPRTGLWWFVKL